MVDVVPTILELLGVKSEGLFQGRSLAALARGQADDTPRTVLSSRLPERGTVAEGAIPESRSGTYLWLDADWKLIYRDDAGKTGLKPVELYDRKKDRMDQNDLAEENPDVVKPLLVELKNWVKEQGAVRAVLGAPGEGEPDKATLERLRALGYIGEGGR